MGRKGEAEIVGEERSRGSHLGNVSEDTGGFDNVVGSSRAPGDLGRV